MPEISIIVPIYNCGDSIRKLVDSLLHQTLTDFELILINDGSTDNSREICDKLASGDSRITALHKENGGAGSARNAGIKRAIAKYIMFPDADDYLEPDMLEVLYNTMTEKDSDLAVCGFYNEGKSVTETVTYPSAYYKDEKGARMCFAELFPEGFLGYPWNKLYKRDIIADNGILFPDMRRYQDGAFNLDYFDFVKTLSIIEKPLYHYGVNEVADMFAKSPINIFDLGLDLAEGYYMKLKLWGMEPAGSDKNMRKFILNSLVFCLESSFSPRWGFSKADREEYVKKLVSPERVKYAFCDRGEITVSSYVNRILVCLSDGRFKKAIRTARVKLFVKKRFTGLFKFLKGVAK